MKFQTVVLFSFLIQLFLASSFAQEKNDTGQLKGVVHDENGALAFANLYVEGTSIGSTSDNSGTYTIAHLPLGKHTIVASFTGYTPLKKKINIQAGVNTLNFTMSQNSSLDEIVITGTLKPVRRSESPVPVEIYGPTFFKKNPTANLFESLQNVNGVRPQLNCSVCNTGDIHINGLEGSYTLVMIDGMPIVSGLSTVYGLSGIPNALIDRVEVVKGPASSLYGSEAVGGLINVITKNPTNASELSSDIFTTSWGETNVDLGFKTAIGNASSIVGINYFYYDQVIDKNNDGFTDLTLQDRISVFNKWNVTRKSGKHFSLAGRFYYEDRWGGQNDWTSNYRGSDTIYGESIYTRRFELLGSYELPGKLPLSLSFSYTDHDQNSFYGTTSYQAKQRIGFSQLTWDKTLKNHDLLLGAAFRYQYYDDNTPATGAALQNKPDQTSTPGIFAQDEITLFSKHKLLVGSRLDYHPEHGGIFTPRIAYKWSINSKNIVRLNAGTGFRVVNLFTEDHAALTGSRDVIIEEDLQPEKSYNVNLNYIKKLFFDNGTFISFDTSAWYTYFTNAIIPDYDTNPLEIRYSNLEGYAVSKGISLSSHLNFSKGVKVSLGMSSMDVTNTENGTTSRQILTESFTSTWGITYNLPAINLSIDYTGNLYGPMRLATMGTDDLRPNESPWWSIQNIQFSYKSKGPIEIYGGVKNLLDWTPGKETPNLIAGADNPFGEGFDATYIYASNQGIRSFLGIRYAL